MSDDEAFIRRIVDSPGDDLPRLVYADWLDERNDPRGAYLRVETEAPGDVTRLTSLTGMLDPVWVARLSRPPAGVCCDHVRFTQSGPRLAPDDTALADDKPELEFPPEVKAFLLNYNGGVPTPGHLRPAGDGQATPVRVAAFTAIRPPSPDGFLFPPPIFATLEEREQFGLPPDRVLIAQVGPPRYGSLYASTAPGEYGMVYWSVGDPWNRTWLRIAPSLGYLLALLTDDPDRPIASDT